MFTLQFDPAELQDLAGRYVLGVDEEPIVQVVTPQVRARGYFTRTEFLRLARWKSPRPTPRYEENTDEEVESLTALAFSTKSERLRIEALTLLRGVQYPVASVMLHFAHADPYPILDYRALEALGVSPAPMYTPKFWLAYTECCRELAAKHAVSMRMLDRALWQFSKERSP